MKIYFYKRRFIKYKYILLIKIEIFGDKYNDWSQIADKKFNNKKNGMKEIEKT